MPLRHLGNERFLSGEQIKTLKLSIQTPKGPAKRNFDGAFFRFPSIYRPELTPNESYTYLILF